MIRALLALVFGVCGIADNAHLLSAQKADTSITDVLQAARVAVVHSDESLSLKAQAHRILAQDLGSSMTNSLADGLLRELKILQLLQAANPKALTPLLDAEVALVAGRGSLTKADLSKMIDSVSSTFADISKSNENRREQRQAFKRLLGEAVARLIAVNPAKTSTYVRVQAELDPDALDLELTAQQAILTSLSVALNAIK